MKKINDFSPAIEMYKSGMSVKEISEKIGLSDRATALRLKRNGIAVRPHNVQKSSHYKEDFSKWSYSVAFVYGVVCHKIRFADQILSVSSVDKDYLLEIKSIVSDKIEVKTYHQPNSQLETHLFRFGTQKMIENLRSLVLEKMPKEFRASFLRGLWMEHGLERSAVAGPRLVVSGEMEKVVVRFLKEICHKVTVSHNRNNEAVIEISEEDVEKITGVTNG